MLVAGGVLALFLGQAFLLIFAGHRAVLLARWWRSRHRAPLAVPSIDRLPRVTVQLPVYNERRVVERLIEAATLLDYPSDLLEIQVLDDSTDETSPRVEACVARARERGVDVRVLRRTSRAGFKAGALANGLERARGEIVVVFDADFVPAPDFLRRIVGHFDDPAIGMVQARWGHLNRDATLWTVAQAVLLDAHFLLEHATRMREGLFFNFNGTAGAWRRAAIEDAGGWSHDTLTEDLDLSYRAQLAGWRFAFDPGLICPAELPGPLEALKSQQRRWTRGSIQTARKLLPRVWASTLPLPVKLEALLHLTGNLVYPVALLVGVLSLPALYWAPRAGWLLVPQVVILLAGLVPTLGFLGVAQVIQGVPWWRVVRDVAAALFLTAGLSVNNGWAACAGFGRRLGRWERTAKTGEGGAGSREPGYRTPRGWTGVVELGLTGYFGIVAWIAIRDGRVTALPLALLLGVGSGLVAWESLRPRRARD